MKMLAYTTGAACLIAIITLLSGWRMDQSKVYAQGKAESYTVIEDRMDTRLVIGVRADIDEAALAATLSQAAGDHVNDRARDYLFTKYLWVTAYLIDGSVQSEVSAGKLRRYAPIRNPNAKEEPGADTEDKVYLTLEEAKRSLRKP